MKRVLLIGELNQTVSNINKYLETNFQTQVCMDNLELVKGMAKVFEPDMAIIYLVGVGELDKKILDYFETRRRMIPVLLIGTPEECKFFENYYEKEQFGYLTRPMTLTELGAKCSSVLQLKGEEEIVAVKEETAESKKHILLVDDSGILLRSVKAMLIDQYEVSVATDGKKALERAKRRKPDLILLDYEMPVMDGKETLEEIRQDTELKDIPVVFLTSVANRDSFNSVLQYKPEGYLLKPIDQNRMFETIKGILGN